MQFILILAAIAVVLAVFAVMAPLALFAMKAGVIRPPQELRSGSWKPDAAWRWAGRVAAILTALGALGATAFPGEYVWKGSSPLAAYHRKYGLASACAPGQVFCYPIINVIRWDAVPFFVATTILLYARAAAMHAVKQGKALLPFIAPALVGGAVFFVSVHIWDWVDVVRQSGVVGAVSKMVADLGRELLSPITFIQALMNGTGQTWLENELAQMGLSIYKLASLYPKVFLVFLLGGVIHYGVSQAS